MKISGMGAKKMPGANATELVFDPINLTNHPYLADI